MHGIDIYNIHHLSTCDETLVFMLFLPPGGRGIVVVLDVVGLVELGVVEVGVVEVGVVEIVGVVLPVGVAVVP